MMGVMVVCDGGEKEGCGGCGRGATVMVNGWGGKREGGGGVVRGGG